MCPRSRTAVGTQAANVVFEAAAKKRTYSESADSNWRTAWVGRCIFFVTLLPSSLEKWSLVRGPSGPVGAALRPRGPGGRRGRPQTYSTVAPWRIRSANVSFLHLRL